MAQASCASTELTQYCNQAAGSATQPTIVARLLYEQLPAPNQSVLVRFLSLSLSALSLCLSVFL